MMSFLSTHTQTNQRTNIIIHSCRIKMGTVRAACIYVSIRTRMFETEIHIWVKNSRIPYKKNHFESLHIAFDFVVLVVSIIALFYCVAATVSSDLTVLHRKYICVCLWLVYFHKEISF